MLSKLILAAFQVALFSIVCTAQTVSGTVADPNGDSMAGADVILEREIGIGKRTAVTNSAGRFIFSNVSSGRYILRVSVPGFEPWSDLVSVETNIDVNAVLLTENIAEIVSVSSNFLAGTPESIERTPGSIQTISKSELEGARVFNFAEALRKVSGINIRNEEGFGLRPNISIRGSNPTRSRKVLLLEDGIPLAYAPYGDNSSYYHPPIERFESVEVLKGSGQITYGPVTVAGVVNYLTPNPVADNQFTLTLVGGNRSHFNGTAGFSGTFRDTGFIANFTRKQGDGSRENIRAGVNDFSTKLIQTLNESNVLVVKYSHFDESSRITYSGLTEQEFAENPRQNPFRNDDLEFFREGFSVAHTGVINSRSSITSTFYTSYFSRDWWRQSSNSNQRPNRLGTDPDCTGMADLNTTCGIAGTPRDFRTLGFEPRFNTTFGFGEIRNSLSAGARIHYETQDRRGYIGQGPFSREDGSELTEKNLRNALAFSAFVQNRFVWGDFSITPGLRIERVRFERTNLLNSAHASTSLTQLIPGIGVAFNPFSNTTVFAGVHRGFAPPSTSDVLTNDGGVIELKSELSWNYEAGFRIRPSEATSIEAAFFRNDYENQIIPASVAGGLGSTSTNAGETLQQGFEFNGRVDTSSIFKTDYNIYFQTAYTLVATAEFRGVRYSGVPGFEDVRVTRNRLPYVPKHLATTSVGIEYRGFNAFIENNYVGSQFADDLNTVSPISNGQRGIIAAQTYFSATTNYSIEKWRTTFFFSVKNIADRLFIVDRTRGIYPGIPRLFQTGIKVHF